MNEDAFTKAGNGCDAVQRQISDAADSGAPLPADVQVHVAGCAGCSDFAGQWLHGPPPALTEEHAPTARLAALRERILDRNAAPNVVAFPSSPRRAPWSAWVGRVAAGILLAAFSYWLLDPAAAPPGPVRSSADSGPTLGQGVSKLEDKSRGEREAIATAVVGGSRQVNESLRWSVSALEL